MKKSEETRIVLDCDFDKIEMILQQVLSECLVVVHIFLKIGVPY